MKKTEPEYYPPVENLLDLIYEHYTENNPVEKNTVAGKEAKAKEKELEEWLRGLDGMNRLVDDYAYSEILSFENQKQMLIPRGFAHGYLTLEDNTLMQWCVDNDFCAEAARAVRYDSDFIWQNEPWPVREYILSEKDRNAIKLSELRKF